MIDFLKTKLADSSKKELLFNSIIAFGLRLGALCVSYVFLLVSNYLFGAKGWGGFAVAFSLLQAMSLIGTLGLELAFVKFIAFKNVNLMLLYKKVIRVVIAFNILLTFLFFSFAPFIASFFEDQSGLETYIRYISWGILPMSLLQIHAGIFRGLKIITLYSLFDNLGRFGLALLILGIGILFNDSYTILFISYMFSLVILTIISFFLVINTLKKHQTPDKVEDIPYKEIRSIASSLFSVSFSNRGIAWSTTLLMAFFLSQELIGIYDTCFRIASLTNIVLFAVNSISAPQFADAYTKKKDNKSLEVAVLNSSKIVFWAAVPGIVILVLIGPTVLAVFGNEFTQGDAYTVLLFLLVGQLFNNIAGPVGMLMQMAGMHKVYGRIVMIGAVLSIMLQYLFIEKYHIVAVGAVNAAMLIYINIISPIYVYKKLNIRTFYIPYI